MSDAAPQNETALQEFLAYLQDNGFPCGVGERVRAYRVVEHFGQQNPSTRWNSLLGPIFARNPGEQQRFHQAFEEFFREGPRKEPPPAIEGQPRLERAPEWRAERPQIPWRLVGIALLMSFCIGAFFYWDAPGWIYRLTQSIALPKPPPPPGYPPPELTQTSPVAERSYRRIDRTEIAKDNRPCQRWECVASGWRPWVVAAPLALLLLFALFLRTPAWRRVQLLHRESRRAPPFSWPPFGGRPRFAGYRDLLANAAQVMSKRLAADSDQLDVPATIRATIRAAGFPSIRFRKDQKAPEYLFLIERRAPGDHFTAWWTALADELRALGVRIDCYYHGGDSQLFRSANNAVNVTAHRLLDLHPSHSVLLLGECSTLLNPYSGELTAWAVSLDARDNRAVLTPEAGFEWGLPEAVVQRRLTLLPARVRNLPAMLKTFDSFGVGAAILEMAEADETAAMPDSTLRDFDPDSQEEIERAGRALRFHLDSDVFDWLCACAVHPDLQWELTMELGRTVDPSGTLFSEPKLLQLIRLKWFREGAIPGPWRAWLVRQLDPRSERTVRELLVAALFDHRAPENSFAHDWQDLQVAAQRYWLSPEDSQRRLELELVMSTIPAVDVDRDYLLARLRAEWRARPAAQKLVGEQRKSWHTFKERGWKFAALGLSATALLAAVAIRTPVEYRHYVSLPPTYEVVYKTVSTATPETAPSYGVIAGKVVGGLVLRSDGYHLSVSDGVRTYDVALNLDRFTPLGGLVQVRYRIEVLRSPSFRALAPGLKPGLTPIKPDPGGLAIDYLRGEKLTHFYDRITPSFETQLTGMLNSPNAVLYAVGRPYPDGSGIGNIHVNQGFPPGPYAALNGIWHDGALIFHSPKKNEWTGVFFAFPNQSLNTDERGNPISDPTFVAMRVEVTDEERNPVAGATIRISGDSSSEATANSLGVAEFKLPRGNYSVTVTSSGQKAEATNIGITGELTLVPITLRGLRQPPTVAPTIREFIATPTFITEGYEATLSWQVENAAQIAISPASGPLTNTLTLSGSTFVSPSQTTTYTLTASGKGGVSSAQATVTVSPEPPQLGAPPYTVMLRVRVVDENGAPVGRVPVTVKLAGGEGPIVPTRLTTPQGDVEYHLRGENLEVSVNTRLWSGSAFVTIRGQSTQTTITVRPVQSVEQITDPPLRKGGEQRKQVK